MANRSDQGGETPNETLAYPRAVVSIGSPPPYSILAGTSKLH